MLLKDVFKMPTPVKITGRSSSITNSFVNGIIPIIEPTEDEIRKALSILNMNENTMCCAYCGNSYTEWDHLRPLVINKTATGYISEIHNLVPACGKCNQSKGNQNWREWMYSSASLSPASRKISDIDQRYKRLSQYEKWGTPIKIDIESIIGSYKWQQHWNNCNQIQNLMKESQILSDEIKEIIQNSFELNNSKHKDYINCNIKQNTDNFNKSLYDIDRTKPIGKIVQNEFILLLKSDKINDSIINFLQKKDYSKQIFDVNYPILLLVNSPNDYKKGIDHTGRNRYYSKPISLHNNLYLLTSQWYDRSKDKLISWMSQFL